jgi:hypothetical protein
VRTGTRLLLVFCLSAGFLTLTMDREINVYDEGIILTGAMRVAAGEIPHRDFYANYGPAQFYIVAALFKLFGPSVLIERAWDVLVRASVVAICYAFAVMCCRKAVAIVVGLACAAWLAAVGFPGYPLFPALLFALISAAFTLKGVSDPQDPWSMARAGVAVGIVALFRYDVGFYVFWALAAAVVATVLSNRAGPARNVRGTVTRLLAPYVLGTTAVFGLPALLYLATSPVASFVHDIIVFPRSYIRMRSLPFPTAFETLTSVEPWAIYLPLLIFAAVIGVLALRVPEEQLKTRRPPRCDALLLVLTCIGIALYLKGVVRTSTLHVVGAVIPSLVLLGALLERTIAARRLVVLAGAGCALAAVSTVTQFVETAKSRHASGSAVYSELRHIARNAPVYATPPIDDRQRDKRVAGFIVAPHRMEVIHFLTDRTRPDERIFVGLAQHDRIFANDNLTYFAANRMPATRWHHFDPGLQTSAAVQREIVSELERHHVQYVVLSSEWDDVREPNESRMSSGTHLLDEYIRERFRQIARYGKLVVLSRHPDVRQDPF